jgi:hypothetical protein
MWWAKAEARVQDAKKQRRRDKKAERAASQSPSQSQKGSQPRQSTLDGAFERSASRGVEDDEQNELVLDAELQMEMMDAD